MYLAEQVIWLFWLYLSSVLSVLFCYAFMGTTFTLEDVWKAEHNTVCTINCKPVKLKMHNKQEPTTTKHDWHVDWRIVLLYVNPTTNTLWEGRRDFLYVTQVLPVNSAGPTLCVTYRPSIKIQKNLSFITYCTINIICWSCPLACDYQDCPFHDKSRNDWYVIFALFFTNVS